MVSPRKTGAGCQDVATIHMAIEMLHQVWVG